MSKQRNYREEELKENITAAQTKKALQITRNFRELSLSEPFLLNKSPFHLRKTLIGDGEIINSVHEIAGILNRFFSNIVSNLNLTEYPISNPYYNKVRNPVLKGSQNQRICLIFQTW